MLYTEDKAAFARLITTKESRNPAHYQVGLRFMESLSAHWVAVLPAAQVAILLFLWNRTALYNKVGQQIWHYQFHKGIEKSDGTRICAGVGMSDNTLRKHVAELCEADFIHIYRCAGDENKGDLAPRLYEINFNSMILGGEKPMLPVRKIDKKAAEQGVPKIELGTSKIGTHKISIYKDTGKPVIPPLASQRRSLGLPVPKKAGTVSAIRRSSKDVDQTDYATSNGSADMATAQGVLKSIANQHATKRETRIQSAAERPAHLIDKLQLQALLDSIHQQYTPNAQRMIVTNKELGLLKKRMKENAPSDLRAFLVHTLSYWHNIARQHGAAIRKNATRVTERAIPQSPDFAALAYRYPYFLKIFANHSAQRTSVVAEQAEQTRVARLEKELEESRENIRVLRRRTPTAVPTRQAPQAPARATNRVAIFDDELPTWEDHEKRRISK